LEAAQGTPEPEAGSFGNFRFQPNHILRAEVETDMNKTMSVALLIVGAILLFYGFQAGDSVGSDVSRAVTGTPTDKTVWFLVGGAIAGVLGLLGLFRGSSGSR
jgi:hypothetical protein